jgi:XRE family transcriptional regulator, regulator of sulfur utilization
LRRATVEPAGPKPAGRALNQQAVGEHVRHLRDQAGLSLRDLGKASGFSASLLSQLENGLVSPSIHSMERISSALGVTLAAFFFAVGDGNGGGGVTRAKDRRRMASSWSKAGIEGLSSMSAGQRLEPLIITLEPGGRSGPRPVTHPTEEFALVLKGRPVLQLDSDEFRLSRGDAVTLLPRQLRLWTNAGSVDCSVLVVALRANGPRSSHTSP